MDNNHLSNSLGDYIAPKSTVLDLHIESRILETSNIVLEMSNTLGSIDDAIVDETWEF